MLNVIFVSDDLDATIGSNCVLSHKHLTEQVDFDNQKAILLNGDLCTSTELEKAIATFGGGKFIVVAFSHGCEDALISNAELTGYVSAKNSYFFASSFIYTNSCYSGVKLKEILANAGCLGYVGYTDKVKLPENEDDDILFIACENSGMIHFLNSGDSLVGAVEVMKMKYREQYRAFADQNMNLAAAFLLHNLNSLTYYDAGSLTRQVLEN